MNETSPMAVAPQGGKRWSSVVGLRGAAVAVAAGLLMAGTGVAPSQAATSGAMTSGAATSPGSRSVEVGRTGSFIVRAAPGRLDEVAARLRAGGYRLGRRIGIIDAVVVRLPAGAAQTLRTAPGVVSVTPDAAVSLQATTYDPTLDVNSMYNLEAFTSARSYWPKGITGAGIDVALIDSGVAPVTGLSDVGKIVNGPDLTPESQNPATRYLDTYGHGTHMAGIIAGRDPGLAGTTTTTASKNTTGFLGVAPDARIVSVKVADAHGNTDVSQVIAGIDWVVQHAKDPGMNIRVLNLSFGTNSTQAYTLDPLAYAAEVAWRKGIVVVVSAGNNGLGGMTNPATNPFVIAVGAEDSVGTKSASDDIIPAFSSQGIGTRLPDLVAPGVHVQSLRVPGSYVDAVYGGTATLATRYFRGSGSSQAAAFVSGGVAQVLQAHPTWTPDQVKTALRSTARHLDAAGVQAQGQGALQVSAAIAATPATTAQTFTPSIGTGTLEAARGDVHLVLGGVTLTGEKDINGQTFGAAAMATAEATGSSWSGGTWNGSAWAGSSWSGSSWASTAWTGSSWSGSSWSGSSWSSGTWSGSSWSSTNWSGSSWSGSSWSGSSWSGKAWADNTWS
jgi:serine protease AprX